MPLTRMLRATLAFGLVAVLAACQEEAPPEIAEARPVRTVTIVEQSSGEVVWRISERGMACRSRVRCSFH
jgi:hypothetical protein